MATTKFLWILSLNVLFLIGKVTEIDGISTVAPVTGVEAELNALNTTALQLIWNSLKSDNVSIELFEIKLVDVSHGNVTFDNETDFYNYTITGLIPGANYTVVLIVHYAEEIPDTTTTVTTVETTVTSPDTTSSAAPTTRDSASTTINATSNMELMHPGDPELRLWSHGQESIYLFNNTYPATPINVTLTGRDTQSLTFSWTQDGEANGCSMWIDNATTTTSPTTTTEDCQFTGDGDASGTISGLPVAGRLYTVNIVSISGGLSSNETQIDDRTLPPNPSAAQCISQTNASLTFQIPQPYDQPPFQYDLDEYEVIMESLVLDQPFTYYTNTSVGANASLVIPMPINDLDPGVTYNITLTTMVAGVRSADSNSSNCVTELNVPVINNVINTTEQTIQVAWQTPLGYYEGFNLSCIGNKSAKNVYDIHEQISNNTEYQLIDECHNATAGALYEVNVASVLLDSMLITSNASNSLSTVTVPFAPKDVTPSNAATNFIEILVNYDYGEDVSQCTHFEVKDLVRGTIHIVPNNDSWTAVEFQELDADSSYNFSTTAISNYSETDSNFWRSSYTSAPTTAWTLAPSVSNIQQLKQEPWSLLVQFDQPETHEHVWQYVIHVNTGEVRFKTINLICSDVHEEALTELNCDTSSAETAEMHNVTCRTTTPCELATVIPESTTRIPDSTASGSRREPVFSDEEPPLDRVSNGTAQSICHNISGLDPYINYTISIQAVNPGGCSQKATADFMTLGSTPGCVNITSVNAGNVSIEVHWAKPDQPNGVITQYVITCQWQDGFPFSDTTNETFYTIKAVPPYSNYTITVAAETELGVGDVSECPSSTAFPQTGIGRPYMPIIYAYATSPTSFNISWSMNPNVTTGPETYYNLTVTDSVNDTWIIEEHLEGFYNRTVVVKGLDEYWCYYLKVVAYTISENSVELPTYSKVLSSQTAESTPGPVQSFNATSLSYMNQCNSTRVVWDQPTNRDLNGKITGYQLRWSKVDGSDFKNQSFPPGDTPTDVRVEPNGQVYNFTIMAFTSVGFGTPVNSSVVSTGFCRPASLDVNDVLGDPSENSVTTFTVAYDPALFLYNDNGDVIASALLVSEDIGTLNDTEQYGGVELFNGTETWSMAVQNGPPIIPEYRPTSDNWLNSSTGTSTQSSSVRHRRTTSATYIVGNNKEECSGSYCNGPLKSNRKYRVRAVVCTQMDKCLKTALSVIFITQAEPDDLAWIAGVVIGVLALIALIAFLIYFFLFKNRRYGSESSNKEIHLPDFPHGNPEEIARPVRIVDFPAHVVEMHRNSDLEFNDEYQSIQTHSARRPWTAAERPKNRVKNRFVNILPFDHSRVVLRMRDDDDDTESDYINANYIPTMGGGIREFIACQGPLESTIDDFWQMVWEHNSRVIVMLTNVKEKGREKCAQYWPGRLNEPSRYRTIDVSLMSESHMDYYVVRNLKVSMGTHTRDVVQFHFVSWPDFGVPAEPEKVLAFVREVRQCAGHNLDPPMIVHCSAGVGRTGTFIVIDRLLREIPRAETIDIFSMVLHLRENRCLMVQTEAQYVFIHDCMKLEIESMLYGNQGYDDQYEEYISEEPIYQNSDQNQIDSNNVGHQTFKSD